MMNTGKQLLQAILDNPQDDDMRLVYADWLEEHGQERLSEWVREAIVSTLFHGIVLHGASDIKHHPESFFYKQPILFDKEGLASDYANVVLMLHTTGKDFYAAIYPKVVCYECKVRHIGKVTFYKSVAHVLPYHFGDIPSYCVKINPTLPTYPRHVS